MDKMSRRRTRALFFLFAAAASILCEVFLFNLRALRTAGYEWISLPAPEISGDLTNDGSVFLRFNDLNTDIRTCHILIDVRDQNGDSAVSHLQIYFSDDGNQMEYPAGNISYTASHDGGSYFPVTAYGRIHSLSVKLTTDSPDCTFTLRNAEISGSIPFRLSVPRIAALFLVFLLCRLLRPSSAIYDRKIGDGHRVQRILIILIILTLNIAVLGIFAFQNRTYAHLSPDSDKYAHHFQYAKLARAFAEGRTWIDTPDDAQTLRQLADLQNPYDRSERNAVGVSRIWDTAYYNNHLYVYFGAVPVLLCYLPYYLLTGNDLPTIYVCVLSGALCVLAAFFYMHTLIRKFFPDTPVPVYVLLSLLLGNGTGVLSYAIDPNFYIVPINFSIFFVLIALSLWIRASEHLSLCLTAAGSLCAAAVAGCRPQFLIFSVLSLPIFIPSLTEEKNRKKILKWIPAFLLPFAALAVPAMYYNAIRFGSPFDFGANYNLTTNDMLLRGFRPARLPDGFFAYLFQLPNLSIRFPYVLEVPKAYSLIGRTISESMFGGVLLLFPFLWLLFFLRKTFRLLRKKHLALFTVLSIASALLVVAVDTEMAGILWRYTSDFLLLLYLSASVIFLSLLENADSKERSGLFIYLSATAIITLLICLLSSLTGGRLFLRSPETYCMLKDFFSFH